MNRSEEYSQLSLSSEYSQLSSYATCLDFIRDPVHQNCTYGMSDALTTFYSGVLVTGWVNNAMSVIVFFQAKYAKRLISKLLRVFYLCNMLVLVTLALNILINYKIKPTYDSTTYLFLKRSSTFGYSTCYKCSVGVLTYIAILKCVNVKFPFFIASSRHVNTISILVLMLVFTISCWLHIPKLFVKYDLVRSKDLIPSLVFYYFSIFAIFISNLFWIYSETRRHVSVHTAKELSKETKKLFKFGLFSSSLYVTSTLPLTVFYLLNFTPFKLEDDCHFCLRVLEIGDYLSYTMYCGGLYHNIIYVCLSKVYRRDLVWGLGCLCRYCNRGSDGGRHRTNNFIINKSSEQTTNGV